MARRSRKSLQAEGQLSLFAMTDDFLFAVTENTENAVDKAAESRSYLCKPNRGRGARRRISEGRRRWPS